MAIGQGPGPLPHPACTPAFDNCAHEAAWLHRPRREVLGDLSVEAFQLGVKGGHQLTHSPGEPLQNCSHSQFKAPAAATMWRPGGLLSDISGPGLQLLQEDPDLLLAIHWATRRTSAFTISFCLFILIFLLLFLLPLLVFLLEWVRHQDFILFRLASLRSSSFKNASNPENFLGK